VKTRILVRLIGGLVLGGMLFLAYGSFWFAPAAQASPCVVTDPSKHIPVLRLPEPIKHREFVVQEKAGQLEVRNTSAEPIDVLPITTTTEFEKQRIGAKNSFTINITNAFLYLENTPHVDSSSCFADGGVPDGQPTPRNINTVLSIRLAGETVDIPVEITYVANPKYASQLSGYQEHQQMGQNYLKGIIFMAVILPLGGMLLFICVAVIIIAVQWNGKQQ
jgi:hypothetical protein